MRLNNKVGISSDIIHYLNFDTVYKRALTEHMRRDNGREPDYEDSIYLSFSFFNFDAPFRVNLKDKLIFIYKTLINKQTTCR